MNHTQNLRDSLIASATLPPENMAPNLYWNQLGFEKDGDSHIVPPAVVVIESTHGLKTRQLGAAPRLSVKVGERKFYFYREGKDLDLPTLHAWLDKEDELYCPGQRIKLPIAGWAPASGAIRHITELDILDAKSIPDKDTATSAKPFNSPLLKYSLQGQSDEFQRNAVKSEPLLGDVCRKGQVSIIYGAPNVGKTLIMLSLLAEAVQEKRIEPGRVIYVNADDNSDGLSLKMRLLDDLGCHTLVPGYKGFKAGRLITDLQLMAEMDQAKDTLLIIDTVKKFASVMDKKDSSALANACRQVAVRGGAVVALAHTNKNPDASGQLRYAGTTDWIEDADAAYLLSVIGEASTNGERVVEFKRLKSRSDAPERAGYVYASETGLSYEERVASVRAVDANALQGFQIEAAQRSDAEVIEAALTCLNEGTVTKMAIAKAVSKRLGMSQRDSIRVIERYTGTDPATHRWNYAVASHGRHVFSALSAPADPA